MKNCIPRLSQKIQLINDKLNCQNKILHMHFFMLYNINLINFYKIALTLFVEI